MTTNTFAINDGGSHAGYLRYNEREETFNEVYSVPVSDSPPTCIEIYMGSTLSQAHFSRTIDRALILMGFYPDVAEAFADRFVAQAERTGWDSAAERFSGWFVNGWTTSVYKGVTLAQDDLIDCIASTTPTARPPYTIPLVPGWSLISFPGTPADTAIGSVIGADLSVSGVLGYQSGAWVSAIRTSEGWSGTLTEITGGWGYWVQSSAVETISVVIPDADTSSELLTVPVTPGWNLLGVVDAQLRPYGEAHSGRLTMDGYLGETPWGVGFIYSTGTGEWTKLLPGDGSVLRVGSGYWVWTGDEPPPDGPPGTP